MTTSGVGLERHKEFPERGWGGSLPHPPRDAKRATLVSLRARLKLSKDETLVAGDGANDLDMILEAGLGVAFRAKPKIAAAAPARIDHGDLTALLYVQGYHQKEFVTA